MKSLRVRTVIAAVFLWVGIAGVARADPADAGALPGGLSNFRLGLGQVPGVPELVLPVLPVPPVPPPPAMVTRLPAGALYVAQSDGAYLVLASPTGLVKVTKEDGPVTIRGVFVDGNGKMETRKFTRKYVWLVEALTTGKVELLLVPPGAADESKVTRVTLDVDAGPVPPGPGPGPGPAPDPADPLFGTLKAAWAEDYGTKAQAHSLAAIYQAAVKVLPTVATAKALFDAMKGQIGASGLGGLSKAHRVIGDELNAHLKFSPTAALTDPQRAACAEQFTRVAALLEALAR